MPLCIYHTQDCLPAQVYVDILSNDSVLLAVPLFLLDYTQVE